jgi:hypothetical protein
MDQGLAAGRGPLACLGMIPVDAAASENEEPLHCTQSDIHTIWPKPPVPSFLFLLHRTRIPALRAPTC